MDSVDVRVEQLLDAVVRLKGSELSSGVVRDGWVTVSLEGELEVVLADPCKDLLVWVGCEEEFWMEFEKWS